MKKQATNKMALKNEVNDLLTKQKRKELKSALIILTYNSKFKIDRYTLNLDPEYDEHKNFSMDSLTEAEAKTILNGPDAFPVIFQNGKSKDPDWLNKIPGCRVEVPVNESELIDIERFFNHEYERLEFPQIIVPDGHYNYWDHIDDPGNKWWRSEERKLWQRVTALWKKVIEDREEKATM